ncbi:probable cytochrome P450 304a1 [Culex quinquefasciatus]|uniref:probable cytochrome P450 304a1 n=1 Tax=Culex quinquefasciatus TaxID=7176 RepID=UPI0018E2AA0A|nr:probable cytochrome P450 304a1 [Culex quinquefasciatus]
MNRVDFDDRPDLFMARIREKNFERRGILFTDGPRLGDDYGTVLSVIPWIRHLLPNATCYNHIRKASLEMNAFIDSIVKKHLDSHDDGLVTDEMILALVDFFFPATFDPNNSPTVGTPTPQPTSPSQDAREIGDGTLDDSIKLSFAEATLRESLRIDTLVPSGMSHVVLHDTTLRGYDIPKGTLLMLGLTDIHNQRDVWGDPELFRIPCF